MRRCQLERVRADGRRHCRDVRALVISLEIGARKRAGLVSEVLCKVGLLSRRGVPQIRLECRFIASLSVRSELWYGNCRQDTDDRNDHQEFD